MIPTTLREQIIRDEIPSPAERIPKTITLRVQMFGKPARRCRICAAASHRRWVQKQHAKGSDFRLRENKRARERWKAHASA